MRKRWFIVHLNLWQCSIFHLKRHGSSLAGVSFQSIRNFVQNLPNFILSIYSGHGCSIEVQNLVQRASEEFLRMENNNCDEEKIYYPKKKLWNQTTETNENKYKKSLTYLVDKLTSTVPGSNPSPLLFRLINIIFFDKIK